MDQVFPSLSAEDLAQIAMLAKDLHNSKLLPPGLTSKEQVQAILILGREIGVPTMAAVRGIQIVQGVPVITPALMLALALRSRDLVGYEIAQSTDETATVIVQRRGFPLRTETFTIQDAERFGFTEQAAWIEQPRAMLRWHAIALALRFDFADLFFGLFLPHEISGATADDQGTAYAQAADIHAESPWKPSRQVLAARAISAATRAPAPLLEAAPAPARGGCVGVGDGCGADAQPAQPVGYDRPICPPGGHVMLGYPRCAVCKRTREEVDAQLPHEPLQPESPQLPAPLATPATERLAVALAEAGTESVRAEAPRASVPARDPSKCWGCGGTQRIPIDEARPELGDTGCLICDANQTTAEGLAESAPVEVKGEAAPQAEVAPDGQQTQAAAVSEAAPAGGKLFQTEGVGELQMQILETASKILPPGGNLRNAMEKWVKRRYGIDGGLPALVKECERRQGDADWIWKTDPAEELAAVRDLFLEQYEKKVQAAVAEAAQEEDKRGK